MRIAMIGSRGLVSRYSGIETALSSLSSRLVKHGHSVTVYGDRENVGSHDGVQLQSVPAFPSKHLETLTRSLLSVLHALPRKFDVIHLHDVAPAVWSPAAKLARVPTVLTLHSLDWKRARWNTLSRQGIRLIERMAVRQVGRIAVVSNSLQEYLRAAYGLDSVVLPNAVEPSMYVKPTSFSAALGLKSRQYILFTARLVREKAAHDLIRAFRAVSSGCKLVIAGESRYDTGYARELHELARGTATVFTGHLSQPQLQELYANAGLFVLPSHVEGRSMALLEALAHGLPVLVSDIPENREVVIDPCCRFPPGDVSELTAKLTWLLHAPEEAQRLGARAVEACNASLDWNTVAAGYERLYREVTGL
jgi:glycosyltransferase involved in cell wall biosynthesis